MANWDLIIIGAGPAGLTAGIYAGRSGLKSLILEEKLPGGEAAITPWVENYPGFENISGSELTQKMTKQCKKFGTQINEIEKVTSLEIKTQEKLAKTDKASYLASAVIISTGTHYRLLNVPGEKEFQGKGVSYCALCDGAFFKNKRVIVVGGGNSAVMSARYLSNIAKNVKLIHRRNQLRADKASIDSLKNSNVELIWNSELKEIKGENMVESVILLNKKNGNVMELETSGVFVQIGEVPNNEIIKETGINMDEEGYIITDSRQRTNIPGVFAAGDVTCNPIKQIGTAVGQAIVAATEAFGYIKQPYYYEK